jgi:AcrR family transcriptional regulator
MRVSSISSNPIKASPAKSTPAPIRREPQQDRAAKRVERFLEVAEELFVEVGFESATMTAVAERSGSSIGALYSYFPDKTSLADALLLQYRSQIMALWTPLLDRIGDMTDRQFAGQLIERLIDVVNAHPAYLQLSTSGNKFRRDPAARRGLREAIANALRKKSSALTREDAMLCANVLVQMIKGMKTLYTEAAPKDRQRIIDEYQQVMALYLKHTFSKTS